MASSNLLGKREPEYDLETKPILKRQKENSEEKETTKGFSDSLQQIELLETKSDQETVGGLDSVETAAARKRTLSVYHIFPRPRMSDLINFFKDVGEVVHIRRYANRTGNHLGYGYVEFAFSNEAKKAQETKNGEYLCGSKITLDVAEIDRRHKYEDYLRREGLLIEEEKAVEGLDETLDLAEEVAVREKTLFYTNPSCAPYIKGIIRFFEDVAKVKSVRVMVDDEGKRLGCGFVEFASANDAKAQKEKFGEILRGRIISLYMAKIAPYPLRPKYNLAEKLWYGDYLQHRESLLIEEEIDLDSKPIPKRDKKHIGVFSGKKITFSDDDS